MSARSLARIVGIGVVAAWAALSAPVATPAASADPCSDVAVVFARGTHQEPGLANVGQAFVDSLTSQVGGRSVNAYAVNYPANDDYHNSATAGSNDASAHIQDVVASCPNTKLVLGGYSQGSTVMDLASQAMPAPGGRPTSRPSRSSASRPVGSPASLGAASHCRRSARRSPARPSACALPTTRFAPPAATSWRTFRTSSPGWSTRLRRLRPTSSARGLLGHRTASRARAGRIYSHKPPAKPAGALAASERQPVGLAGSDRVCRAEVGRSNVASAEDPCVACAG